MATRAIRASVTPISELAWLSSVRESGPQLGRRTPIWVRYFVVKSGPALPHPECHPYCELGLHTSGSGVEFVERENAVRQGGDVFLAGPGVPHWFKITRYPLVGTAIYFLPSLLCEMGPEHDGIRMLRRFTARQSLRQRLVRPPPVMRTKLVTRFEEIRREFDQPRPQAGTEIRMRTLLMDILVDIVRWEEARGQPRSSSRRVDRSSENDASLSPKWEHVNRALHFLHDHFAHPVYARDVARAAGVSESRLNALFREALGVPWSRYIQGYRIQQAVAMLGSSDRNVTQAALAVGFESLSHFDATFRAFMGTSPGEYLKRRQSKNANV